MCVSEERGHGEGAGAHPTLLTDTRRRVVSLAENAGRMPGVEMREPRNLCVSSTFRVILSDASLVRMLPTFDLSCEENVSHLKWKWPLVDCAI